MHSKSISFFQIETISQPLIDLYETLDSLVFKIDLPDINPENVLIKVFDDIVIIEGIRRERREGKKYKYLCMERPLENFRRIIRLPISVNHEKGRATYNDGVVTLKFPIFKGRVIRIETEK